MAKVNIAPTKVDIDSKRKDTLDQYALEKGVTTEDLLSNAIAEKAVVAEVYYYSKWWDGLSHEQKLSIYEANQ